MPPLRPPLFLRYRGYVCPSCTAKIQAGPFPPWLVRTATSQATKSRGKERPGNERLNKETELQAKKVTVNHFNESLDGTWEKDADEENAETWDAETLQSKIEELEAELEDTKGRLKADAKNPYPHLTYYDENSSGRSDLLDRISKGKSIEEEDLKAAVAELAEVLPPEPENEENSRMNGLELEQGEALSAEDVRAGMPWRPIRTKDGQELDVEGLRFAISAKSTSSHATVIPVLAFPEDKQVNILRLNVALEKTIKNVSTDATRKDLWKWYSLSRKGLAQSWTSIPTKVWTILWNQFSIDSMSNPDRIPHIRRLGQDMKDAGVKLDTAQTLLYLEALFLEGNHDEAIREWESSRAALIYDPVMASSYWALGTRMLANDNRPDEGQQAADILLNGSDGEKDIRVLLPLIRSWLASSDTASVQKAWALYVRFKFLVGTEATMEDFDAITGAFLDVQQTDLALAVFRDMMMTGDPSAYHHDSVAAYKRNQKSLGDLHSINFWPGEISWKSSDLYTVLLPKQKNKFFLGSWIKKLIGDDRLDSAAQVMELMCQRGIPPDSRHVNGIIGAWFRTGNVANTEKAEKLAWKMIEDRMGFVKRRSQKNEFTGSVRAILNSSKADFKGLPLSRTSIPATSETFSVLIEYYQQRQKHDRVQELYQMIGAAQISPSTAFLNDMLVIGVRGNRKQWAWATYHEMMKHGVRPDHVTFGLLWQLMKSHVDPVKNRTRAGFPSCRSLFSEMCRWETVLKQERISRGVYELVILCFGLADDQIGTAIALRAMQQIFDIYPDQNTVRSVALQLAKVGLKGSGAPSRRLNLNSDTKRKVAQIAKILSNLKEERVKILAQRGVIFDDMDDKQRSEESILLLCDVLRYTVQTRNKSYVEASWEDAESGGEFSSVERMGYAAAEEMGVSHCSPWGNV
jgi:hypothetical protein